jgi:N-methylhydantoinase A
MGGTTAKATLIEQFEPDLVTTFEVARMYRFKKGSGFPVSVPSVDLVEIGAGGGSLARVDQFGLLKVGPESAGAEPGPACYALGGTVPAVTDADLLLGLLDADGFLGGDMPLDARLAEESAERVADGLGMSTIETAAGIHEVVNQNMAAAARMHGVERGVDLRGVTILAFGGAGPVHACGVADLLESDRVVFPVNASVLSAFGTLVSPVRIDLARSMPRPLDGLDETERDDLLGELRDEGRRVLMAAGVDEDSVVFRYGIDARYVGQGNEITIWVGEGADWTMPMADVRMVFEEEYRRIYGLAIPDVGIEVVTWRLAATAESAEVEPSLVAADRAGDGGQVGTRPVVFERGSPPEDTLVYQREALAPGMRFVGPAVVEERETTSVIRPGWSVEVADDGSLIATRGSA